jgi:hypothetical protein
MHERKRVSPGRTSCALLLVALAAAGGGLSNQDAGADSGARLDDTGGGPGQPSLTIGDTSIAEADAGQRNLVFVVRLSQVSSDTVSVAFATADGSATLADQDYVALEGRLAFAPGSVEESLAVVVAGDTKFEPDEQLIVTLASPVNATIEDGEATGTITNDDPPVLAVSDTSFAEGQAGSRVMAFRVRMSPATTPVTFRYQTADGTARRGEDYQHVAGEAQLAPGESQLVIEVPVLGDSLLEANERFTLRIEDVVGAVPAGLSAIGSILNDERTTFVGFDSQVPPYMASSRTLPPAWGDFEGDGRPDLQLYLNDGQSFTEMPGIRSLLAPGNYHGAAWCDYDRDGDMDLVQTPYADNSAPTSSNHLFENTPQGLLDVSSEAGMAIIGYGETPSWGDFNADGWPDLFLPFYSHVAPFQSFLFVGVGNGRFLECADSAGVSMPQIPVHLRPEGVGVADWNGDGTLDIYCASHLFLNDGDAHFTDVRAQVGLPQVFDEGAQFVDYDDDGDLDLYLRTANGPTLARNDHGFFNNATATLGIGSLGWEYGDRWADVDADGDLDLVFVPPGANLRLLLNNGDGSFIEDSAFVGTITAKSLISFADFDQDGDIDLAAGAYGRQFARNLLEQVPSTRTSHLKVRVEDDDGRLTAHGATLRLRSTDDPRHPMQTRVVDGGSGYLGQDEYTITFGGVGSGTFELEVSYPSKPGSPRVVGPAQNALLGSIQPGSQSPLLVIVRPNGQVTIQVQGPLAGVEDDRSPSLGGLWSPTPNPARHQTRFGMTWPEYVPFTLTVHDLSGRVVRTLVGDVRMEGGATWDLTDDRGREVPPGLYFARLARSTGRSSVQRVVVLR